MGQKGIWSGKRDSNPRPSAWEADALPTELFPLATLILVPASDACQTTSPPEPHRVTSQKLLILSHFAQIMFTTGFRQSTRHSTQNTLTAGPRLLLDRRAVRTAEEEWPESLSVRFNCWTDTKLGREVSRENEPGDRARRREATNYRGRSKPRTRSRLPEPPRQVHRASSRYPSFVRGPNGPTASSFSSPPSRPLAAARARPPSPSACRTPLPASARKQPFASANRRSGRTSA